ncbi:DUF2877 domain-containing protein [Desulfofustis glycolicus]|uniref:DUF2877 domain-containing protein n=1 Tax=Desulfofustis glycolicus DSM 9705 TaxID=1121409 RepID=A0A1M5T900_9BACT|nr:DUF2877 domain-containing protein [Desulfofustis glycolicus]MCB2215424.1 DUF2877 domain-containing protein [Desulfobulbaceae bacterium]SHH47178.1 Protein of unknown function [Desulfofustis glycolicus DSM 9705]
MAADSLRQVITADSVGVQIGPMLSGSARWRITQTYRHCFYCLSDTGDVICIGDAHIDRGPFTITCTVSDVTAVAALAGSQYVQSCDGTMLFGDQAILDTARATPWPADFNTCAGPGAALDTMLATLVDTAATTAPQQSFGALIPAIFASQPRAEKTSALTVALHRRLLQVVDAIRYENAFDDPERLTSLLAPLIGLGYGLTPSGDDFCAGWILSLVAIGKTRQATTLATGLFDEAGNRTTAISLAFFRALAESRLSEGQARLLHCCAAGQTTDLADALHGVYHHGGTSGWDMLAGFAFGIGLPLGEHRFPGLAGSAGG